MKFHKRSETGCSVGIYIYPFHHRSLYHMEKSLARGNNFTALIKIIDLFLIDLMKWYATSF